MQLAGDSEDDVRVITAQQPRSLALQPPAILILGAHDNSLILKENFSVGLALCLDAQAYSQRSFKIPELQQESAQMSLQNAPSNLPRLASGLCQASDPCVTH